MDTDVTHKFGEHEEWNESFYFNFYDKKSDVCGFMRIGLKPNRNEKSMFCFFLLPDGIVGTKDAETFGDDALNVRGLRYNKLVAEKKWKLSYSGFMGKFAGKDNIPVKVSFAFEYDAINKMFDYRQCVSGGIKEEISKSVASEHLEQFGRVHGVLRVGSKEYRINGLGERDHSWGIREWNAPKMWIWLTCQFSDNCALNITKLVVEQGEVDAGFIYLNGKNIPVTAARIDTVYAEDGGPKTLEMVLEDREGKSHNVTASVMREAILPFIGPDGKAMSVMHETLAEYKYEGQTGYGIAEYLIKKQ